MALPGGGSAVSRSEQSRPINEGHEGVARLARIFHRPAPLRWLERGAAARLGAVIVSRVRTSCPPPGYRFPRDVIAVAVRWYLRYGLSYRDVEEFLAERGVTVDHVTAYRWCRPSRPSSSTPPDPPGTYQVVAGSSTKRMSRSAALALRVSRDRPVRPSQRRDALEAAQRRRGTDVRHPHAASQFGAG
jgi:hypothetical protein